MRNQKLVLTAAAALALVLAGLWGYSRRAQPVRFETPYQAVLLTGGQAYFGKLQGWGTATPVLTDVYYVQSRTDPQTKQVSNILVKRGQEWHAPDRMYLNPAHIILVEPVAPNSKVAQLIAESRSK